MFTLPDKEFTRNFQTSSGLALGWQLPGSREMAASAAASAGCAVILEEASSEGEEGDPAAAPPPPPPSSDPPPPPPSLLHSLSVPGHVQDTPYHKLRRASHHIISGRRICFICLSIDNYSNNMTR